MNLYDDDDEEVRPATVAAGWAQGVRASQQLQPKKGAQVAQVVTPSSKPRSLSSSDTPNRGKSSVSNVVAPVKDFKKQKTGNENDDAGPKFSFNPAKAFRGSDALIPLEVPIEREYDPMWPNDYEKVVKEVREVKNRSKAISEIAAVNRALGLEVVDPEEKRKKYLAENKRAAQNRFSGGGAGGSEQMSGVPAKGFSGFGGRQDDDEDERRVGGGGQRSGGGAAIAPPPSLTEGSASPPPINISGMNKAAKPGLGIAAKIMSKYGYRDGEGLGKNKQGISQALVVEKTSRRGGIIINKDNAGTPPPEQPWTGAPPPPVGVAIPPPNLYDDLAAAAANEPAHDDDEYGGSGGGSSMAPPSSAPAARPKPSITDMMKNPGKVVMMMNMVGPGEVDAELEPEVKEECETKYGDIVKVQIVERNGVPAEEAVRIFLEFKRVESAIKALVDLNGRFFGGREVQACFYNGERFHEGELLD